MTAPKPNRQSSASSFTDGGVPTDVGQPIAAEPLDPAEAEALVSGRHGDPFARLGRHAAAASAGWVVRALVPGAEAVSLVEAGHAPVRLFTEHPAGLFSAHLDRAPGGYKLEASNAHAAWTVEDPYAFGPVLGEMDEHLIAEGAHLRLWEALGAHSSRHEGVEGTRFAVWAPNAKRVSVVGPFNDWDGRRHAMRRRGSTGVWEIFAPGVGPDTLYKFEVLTHANRCLPLRADPVGQRSEMRPATASVVPRPFPEPAASERAWRESRAALSRTDAPVSIYEVHLGSWMRHPDGRWYSYAELAERLIPYVVDMGFTHIEVLPVHEYPFDGSWGYQPIGLYAPTSRFGTPEDFDAFVAACHAAGLGLILDWVPGHFPTDAHGLAKFDGTALYEHADPKEGFHRDWNTLIYNFGRSEVANFLIANALYWTRVRGVDGLRVDAVASMLYRDYSREEGEWVPNRYGGRENLEAIAFLRRMNEVVYGDDASVVTIAEESTAWPGVSKPVHEGGLGFGYKWNMGWMHDTLEYIGTDPLYRVHKHDKMTFGMLYAFSENFILPLSHDEVVHGKGSILGRMPGDRWRKFANLRAYYAFMFAHPGKKLLFMGQEFGQETEWNHDIELPWGSLVEPLHKGCQDLVRALNGLYRNLPALHQRDCQADGFQWIDGSAAQHSVYSWVRWGEDGSDPVMAVFNFSGVPHEGWRFGVPRSGTWEVVLSTDETRFGGAGQGTLGTVMAEDEAMHGQPMSVVLTLPPLSGLYLRHRP